MHLTLRGTGAETPDGWAALGLREAELARLARVLSANQEDANDLLQEAIVRTLVRYPDFRGLNDPGSYVARVMFRLSGRLRSLASRALTSAAQAPVTGATPGHLDVDVVRALMKLPPRQRACIYLRYVADLPVEEVAGRLGVSAGTVKSQCAKAVRRLRSSNLADEKES